MLHDPIAARHIIPGIPTVPTVLALPALGHAIVSRFALSRCLNVKTCFGGEETSSLNVSAVSSSCEVFQYTLVRKICSRKSHM